MEDATVYLRFLATLTALAMLNAQPGAVRQSKDEADALEAGGQRPGIVPLAVPLLALLLAALAIQTMAEGLRTLFPGLA